MLLIFPPYLINAAALSSKTDKRGNHICSSKCCITALLKDTKNIEIITSSQLNHPSLADRSAVCSSQKQEGEYKYDSLSWCHLWEFVSCSLWSL